VARAIGQGIDRAAGGAVASLDDLHVVVPAGLRLAGPAPVLHASRGALPLSRAETTALLFGPELPRCATEWLVPAERDALGALLPLPLYVWGFDSV